LSVMMNPLVKGQVVVAWNLHAVAQ
jgi:hypothetical protein